MVEGRTATRPLQERGGEFGGCGSTGAPELDQARLRLLDAGGLGGIGRGGQVVLATRTSVRGALDLGRLAHRQ